MSSEPLTRAELWDIFVGSTKQDTAERVEGGELNTEEARFRVGLAQSSFMYLMRVAEEEGIQFVRKSE